MGWCPAKSSRVSWAGGTLQSWLIILLEMVSPIITTLMSETSSNIIRNTGVNKAGTSCQGLLPGMCPAGKQHRPGRHQKIARAGWSKEINVAVMECYFLSTATDEGGKPINGYRKRMYGIWKVRQTRFENNRAKLV